MSDTMMGVEGLGFRQRGDERKNVWDDDAGRGLSLVHIGGRQTMEETGVGGARESARAREKERARERECVSERERARARERERENEQERDRDSESEIERERASV